MKNLTKEEILDTHKGHVLDNGTLVFTMNDVLESMQAYADQPNKEQLRDAFEAGEQYGYDKELGPDYISFEQWFDKLTGNDI